MENNTQDKGFTLVELLIVIVILGILATVTVFAVRGITTQGQATACNADIKTNQTAIEAYFAQNGGTTIPEASPGGAEATLVTSGLLVDVSSNFNVTAAGGLTYENQDCVDAWNNKTPAPTNAAAVGGPLQTK